jgi:putative ABC transport system permease protein
MTLKYDGILRIGYKLLVNDAAKFTALLIGVTFAVFLMTQMTSMFAGVLNRAYATPTNIGASMWVMDPGVNTSTGAIPMPNYLEDAVRSMDGVSYAVPLYLGGGQVKLPNGAYQAVVVLGLDDSSLFGRPELEQGNIQDIYAENGFIVVDDAEFPKLLSPKIGTTFELNNHRVKIVGIARVASNGLNGVPTLYTTYNRALQYLPQANFTLSFLLVQPKNDAAIPGIKREVAKLGYVARTKDEFDQHIADFFMYQTGIGTNILMMSVISFIVGLSISGQTFYTFVLENLDKFGALKAIGARNIELVKMILFMTTFTSLIGYGLGIGLVTILIAIAHHYLPFYAAITTFGNLVLAFAMVVLIAAVSSYFAIRRVLQIEPFDIFRG